MKKLNNLEDLLQYQMQKIFDAENQLIRILPVLEETASNFELKRIFTNHLEETKMQKERMSGMAHDLNIYLKGKTCGVMKKLINQTSKFCDLTIRQDTKDAALITYAQLIEQYEITSYENIIRYTRELGYDCLTRTLKQNMKEESKTYATLYNLWVNTFNNLTRNYLPTI